MKIPILAILVVLCDTIFSCDKEETTDRDSKGSLAEENDFIVGEWRPTYEITMNCDYTVTSRDTLNTPSRLKDKQVYTEDGKYTDYIYYGGELDRVHSGTWEWVAKDSLQVIYERPEIGDIKTKVYGNVRELDTDTYSYTYTYSGCTEDQSKGIKQELVFKRVK